MENTPLKMDLAVLKQAENFTAKLNESPPDSEVRVNKAAKNSRYLPVSFIEMKLDEVFLGQWDFEFKGFQVIANEIVGHGNLTVVHPLTGRNIIRSGTASVMIMQKADADITDISAKYKNTLVKDFPHLESEVLKSCAKKLGKMFGRDLNREHTDEYESIYTGEEEKQAIRLQVLDCKTEDDLKKLWQENTDLHKNHSFLTAIKSRTAEIKSFDNGDNH